MISSITGQLVSLGERCAYLQVGALQYELLIPSFDHDALEARMGTDVTFHTILYLEGDAARGNLEPRLIGFSTANDKAFFEKFTTVKGIGTKTALRALSIPVAHIASAIESRNPKALTQLDGIGKRTAELIIAELAGKVTTFAAGAVEMAGSPQAARTGSFTAIELDAINAMVSLGERRPDAERLLVTVKQSHPSLPTSNDLLREMLRARSL